jgi:hypothetical protein
LAVVAVFGVIALPTVRVLHPRVSDRAALSLVARRNSDASWRAPGGTRPPAVARRRQGSHAPCIWTRDCSRMISALSLVAQGDMVIRRRSGPSLTI